MKQTAAPAGVGYCRSYNGLSPRSVRDYFSQEQIAHNSDIVVAATVEGRGIGKGLSAAEDWARACGYSMIQLHVLVGNTHARSMYERLGYSAEWLKYIKRLGPDAGKDRT